MFDFKTISPVRPGWSAPTFTTGMIASLCTSGLPGNAAVYFFGLCGHDSCIPAPHHSIVQ